MTSTAARLRSQAQDLRGLGWSYRRIAAHLRRAHGLTARLAFRLARGWTQEEAARGWNALWPDEPKTGKSFSYWETWPAPGGREPSAGTLARLARLYLCHPGDLLDCVDYGRLDPGQDEAPVERLAAGPLGRPPGPDFELDLGLAFGQEFWHETELLRPGGRPLIGAPARASQYSRGSL
jgi:hypothetical protein